MNAAGCIPTARIALKLGCMAKLLSAVGKCGFGSGRGKLGCMPPCCWSSGCCGKFDASPVGYINPGGARFPLSPFICWCCCACCGVGA